MSGKGEPIITKIKPLPVVAVDWKAELQTRTEKPKIPITSLSGLNDIIWGFKEKELVVVGARPSQGKSSFALQLAVDFADQGIATWFCSLEMSTEELLERMYCNVMRENNYELRRGRYTLSKMSSFEAYIKRLKLLITCGVGKNWVEILQALAHLHTQPRVVILDYVQVIRMAKRDSRESIDEYITEMKKMAIERRFCVILCSQINRGAHDSADKKPHLAQLKSTGALEEAADKVILLHWAWFYNKEENKNKYEIILAKNRNGSTGIHEVRFTPEHYLFEEQKWSDKRPDESRKK